MTESSPSLPAPSSSVEALILRRSATVKNDSIGQAIGHDNGHVSRVLSGERGIRINEIGAFLKAIGLKVIECDGPTVTIPAEELASIKYLARKGLV